MVTSVMSIFDRYLRRISRAAKSTKYYVLWIFNIFCTPHTVAVAGSACVNDAVINAHCKIYRQFCPNLQFTEDPVDAERCCGKPCFYMSFIFFVFR